MEQEYVIVSRTAIQQRIEELENKMRKINRLIDRPQAVTIKCQINELNQILRQSTPLIPEIEKAIVFGHETINPLLRKESYIASLKLD